MFRALLCSAAAALLLATAVPAQKKSALDKATLEAYVRHLFVLGPQVQVEVQPPKPSDLPGFLSVTVHAQAGNASQDFPFYVSKDGSKIIQGSVFDVNHNPFKDELDKLKTEGAPSFGTAGAPVVLVEFSDFECSYCKQEAKVLRDNLLKEYPTQVRFYFKYFPLETIHPWAKAAAIASACVFRQSPADFWSYHDWIFEHQESITAENLKSQVLDWAKSQKDLDALKLGECMDTKATEADIDKTVAEGRALNITSTPTLFINGRRLAGVADWPTLKSIIDYEIEYQKTAKDAGDNCGCDVKLNVPGMQTAAPPNSALQGKK
ncbi:MAG TPA: DsbA family protein [Bryobacteraceae bacterium]|nr:DsbA family protein [Bryobacteraceae bacterium]